MLRKGDRLRVQGVGTPLPDDTEHTRLSGYLTIGWEKRTFQLFRSNISGSSDSAYPESFSFSIQCRGVLLKLPDIFDRHLEIFSTDILRYFALDICCVNPQSLLVTHLS